MENQKKKVKVKKEKMMAVEAPKYMFTSKVVKTPKYSVKEVISKMKKK
jgi:hypothetical protein